MKWIVFSLCFTFLTSLLAVDFNKDIKPILSKNCFSCHGQTKQKGKLRLDLRDMAISKNAITPGNPSNSKLIEKITSKDLDEIMPPPEKEKLSVKEISLLKEWIKQGAEYDTHWAFKKVKNVSVPQIKDPWILNDIDSFVLKKLSENNLTPKPETDKNTLLRRLSLTLTGLPPDEKLLNNFLHNKISYEEIVKTLLSSPSFGENFAIFWLDGARYADTNGIEYDNSRPIWPYRDWVIKALNDNMPYDQFVTEQLAGDLLPKSKIPQIVATGFNRCNQSTNEQGSLEEEFLVRYAKDRLNTAATVFMGLTVKCAECHDHKFDPVSQKEYYQLLSYFNNNEGVAVGYPFDRSDPPLIPVVSEQKNERLKALEAEIEKLETKLSDIEKKAENDFFFWHYSQLSKPPKTPFLIAKLDSYFAFNETSGNTAFNLITEHQCNIKGIISRTLGKRKNGLKFRASSSVDCLDLSDYEKNQPFSVGAWIKPEKDCEGTIIARYNAEHRKGWKLRIEKGSPQLVLSSGVKNKIIVQSQIKIPDNKWTHITASYNGNEKSSSVKIYINGKSAELKVIQDNLKGSIRIKNNLRIGLDTHMDGLIHASLDEVFSGPIFLDENNTSLIMNFSDESRFALVEPSKLTKNAKLQLYGYYLKNFHETYSDTFKLMIKHKNEIESIFSNAHQSMVMREKKTITPTFVLNRGDYRQKREKVSRDIPNFLSTASKINPNNRLGFANWITNPDHPLTARVMVNRIWNELFGRALVPTMDDFGTQGEYPTHPELLDHLSRYFVSNKWDLKKIVSYIVNSKTFRQNSTTNLLDIKSDPTNHLYSRYPRRRMKAEKIRDQALFISGLLNEKIGGEPVFPYQPSGLWLDVTADISNTYKFTQSSGNNNFRKSIYTFWKRNSPPPSMLLLDAPSRQSCTMKRNISNTATQALALLNDPQFVDLHREIAKKLEARKDSIENNVKYLFQKILSRPPSDTEFRKSFTFLRSNGKNYLPLVQVLMNLDEVLTIE